MKAFLSKWKILFPPLEISAPPSPPRQFTVIKYHKSTHHHAFCSSFKLSLSSFCSCSKSGENVTMSTLFPSEWHKKKKSVRSVGLKLLKWHAEKQSVQHHAGRKKMSVSCMLQSQYIESRGAMGKPGVRLEMKTTSDKYCSMIRWRGDCASSRTCFHL